MNQINFDHTFTVEYTPKSQTSRWLAPEILAGTLAKVSKEAEVFTFGMVAAEVFTGKVPFEEIRYEGEVIIHIREGGRPEMGDDDDDIGALERGLTIEMLEFLEACWQQDPNKRPSMRNVVRSLENIVSLSEMGKWWAAVLSYTTQLGESRKISHRNQSAFSQRSQKSCTLY